MALLVVCVNAVSKTGVYLLGEILTRERLMIVKAQRTWWQHLEFLRDLLGEGEGSWYEKLLAVMSQYTQN